MRNVRRIYEDGNSKANEYLYRRADLQDVVEAHQLAVQRAPSIGFGRYIISATTPFEPDDLAELRSNAPRVVERRVPQYAAEYAKRGWKMLPGIDRVYVNERARKELGWQPRYDFPRIIELLDKEMICSALWPARSGRRDIMIVSLRMALIRSFRSTR